MEHLIIIIHWGTLRIAPITAVLAEWLVIIEGGEGGLWERRRELGEGGGIEGK